MENPQPHEEKTRRAGIHPIIVIFGVIFGLWLFIQFIIPDSKDIQPPQGREPINPQTTVLEEAASAFVPAFKVTARVPEMNAVSILVPEETTDSQIIALLKSLQDARQEGILATIIPPTSPGNELDDFAIADLYIFSDPQYSVVDAIRVLAIGAHAPGEFYSSSIPYEVAMEQVRGHYMVNLNDKATPEQASLGFGEEATGLYSKRFQPLF